jgi:hypothetical protein
MSGSDAEGGEKDRAVDLRLLAPAASGWLTAVLLLGASASTAVWVAVVVGLLMGLGLLMLRLRGWIRLGRPVRQGQPVGSGRRGLVRVPAVVVTGFGVGVVVVGMAVAAGLQMERLQAGPVMGLAESGAAVTARLKVVGDPGVRSTAGGRRLPYVVVRATVEEVVGRGVAMRVRTPVVVIGSVRWKEVRFGQHVEATGRLQSIDKGGDVAAMLSSRVAPRVLDEPAWWLRAAERVRAGLRQSVAGEPEAVRGLVPALVMGDESGLPPELVEDFKTTGLSHLSAVSGANVEWRDGYASAVRSAPERRSCASTSPASCPLTARYGDADGSPSQGSGPRVTRVQGCARNSWLLLGNASRRCSQVQGALAASDFVLTCPTRTDPRPRPGQTRRRVESGSVTVGQTLDTWSVSLRSRRSTAA